MANFYGSLVDELGALKAQIAELSAREKEITNLLKASNEAAIDGDLFRATISDSERETLDSKLVRELLTPEQVVSCTKTTFVTTVRVGARVKAAA
jgi:hypothetical protein